jgi:hypothetical protein
VGSYQLYVIDYNGNSASWSHTNGHRGKPCLWFPDDKATVIVLEHETRTTNLYISEDGVMEVEVIEQ